MQRMRNTLIVAAVFGTMARAVLAADPPIRGGELQFELSDGTVITGRIDAKVITFRIASGNDVKVPVAELTELRVGLNNRPGLVQRVEVLVKALDSDKTREGALRELIDMGPAVTNIVSPHADSEVSARRDAVTQVLKAYKTWSADHSDAPEAMARPLELRSKVQAGINTFVGTLAAREFRVAGPRGPVTVKLDDVYRICPAGGAAQGRLLGWWDVELRDKTRVRGLAISQSLRVQTRYGAIDVPLVQMQKATFADDGKTICVQYRNPDRIVGAIASGTTISLKNGKGRVDLSAGKIAAAAYGLTGHSSQVRYVAFSSDGKRLASGSVNKIIILDTATGKELQTLNRKERSGYWWSFAFSSDGRRLASGSGDGTIKLWGAAKGKELLTFNGHSGSVGSVAFSPDGKRLVSGGYDKTVRLWDTVTGKKLLVLKGHSNLVLSVVFSPDGKRLASGSFDGTIKLWGAARGKELLTFNGHSGSVGSVAFSPDGKRLAGSYGKTIKLWDTTTGKELLTLKGHSPDATSVAFSPGGRRLASGGHDKTIKLWDTVTGKELLTLKGHLNSVLSVAFSPDGKRLASGSWDKTINIWEAPDRIKSPK